MNEFNFNWTMTYRSDAEVSLGAYGFYSAIDKQIDETYFNNLVNNNFDSRKSSGVWVISNCDNRARNEFGVSLASYSNVIKVRFLFKLSSN